MINMFYFNKNTKKIKSAQFYPDRKVGIPIGIVDFRSEFHFSDPNEFFLTFNYEKVPENIFQLST